MRWRTILADSIGSVGSLEPWALGILDGIVVFQERRDLARGVALGPRLGADHDVAFLCGVF